MLDRELVPFRDKVITLRYPKALRKLRDRRAPAGNYLFLKRQARRPLSLIIEIDPPKAIIEASLDRTSATKSEEFEHSIVTRRPSSVRPRATEFQSFIRWLYTGEKEYLWVILFPLKGHRILLTITGPGELEEDRPVWTGVIQSIRLLAGSENLGPMRQQQHRANYPPRPLVPFLLVFRDGRARRYEVLKHGIEREPRALCPIPPLTLVTENEMRARGVNLMLSQLDQAERWESSVARESEPLRHLSPTFVMIERRKRREVLIMRASRQDPSSGEWDEFRTDEIALGKPGTQAKFWRRLSAAFRAR